MTFNKELEPAADYLWNRAIEIYKSDETHGAWTLEIANYTNQLIKELRGVAAIKPIGDTGREQPPEFTSGYLQEIRGDLSWPSCHVRAPGVAPAQAQPEPFDKEMLEAVAEDGLLVTWDKDYKFNFSQVVRLMAEFVIEQRASDSQKGQGWVRVEDGLPKVGQWCWVVYRGAVQRMAAHLAGKGFACADGYEWRWADEEADPAPVEEISHWQPLPRFPPAVINEY